MASVGFEHSGQDFYEGGLPGPVRAHQRHNLPPPNLKRGILQRLNCAKALGDTRGVKNGGIRHGGLSEREWRPPGYAPGGRIGSVGQAYSPGPLQAMIWSIV